MSTELLIADSLAAIPLFSQSSKRVLARLLPATRERSAKAGDVLFEAGHDADCLYYIQHGEIRLHAGEHCVQIVGSGDFVGEEAALQTKHYLSTARCQTDVQLLCFPAQAIQGFLNEQRGLQSKFYASLINHCTDKQHPFELIDEHETKKTKAESSAVGWLFAIIIPVLVYYATQQAGLSWAAVNFLAVFSSAVVMWVFRLVPEYIPALFIVTAVIVLGLVPTNIILAGYSSGSFFMALSVFAIGAVLVQSGLTYRLALNILRITPNSSFGYQISMFFIGIMLTPVLPSANGRAGLIAPLLIEMVDVLGFKRGGAGATRMAAAAFAGISLFSAIFMTAKTINFALFGMLPEQVKDQFTWGYWVYAALIAFVVLFMGYLTVSAIVFRHAEKISLPRSLLRSQLYMLGPMQSAEWVALGGIVLFIVGVMTASVHKIQPPWIGLVILYCLLTLGSISKKGFRQDIDWPFLLMLGGFVGLVKTMSYLQVDVWFAQHFLWIGNFMNSDFNLFILMLGVTIYIIRLVMPNNAAIILVSSIFMPIAINHGINPWIIAFIVLMLSDGWFMPYQCSYYLAFASKTARSKVFNSRGLLIFNGWNNLLRFAAVYASVPFWRSLGLL